MTMDLDDILAFHKLECTGDIARAGWILDQDAILEALVELEIESPVKIKFMTGKYRRGSCYVRDDGHLITLDQNREMLASNRTLWHELTHCSQAEKWSRTTGKPMNRWFDSEYKYARGSHGEAYLGNFYEIEARNNAEKYEHINLLAFHS